MDTLNQTPGSDDVPANESSSLDLGQELVNASHDRLIQMMCYYADRYQMAATITVYANGQVIRGTTISSGMYRQQMMEDMATGLTNGAADSRDGGDGERADLLESAAQAFRDQAEIFGAPLPHEGVSPDEGSERLFDPYSFIHLRDVSTITGAAQTQGPRYLRIKLSHVVAWHIGMSSFSS